MSLTKSALTVWDRHEGAVWCVAWVSFPLAVSALVISEYEPNCHVLDDSSAQSSRLSCTGPLGSLFFGVDQLCQFFLIDLEERDRRFHHQADIDTEMM